MRDLVHTIRTGANSSVLDPARLRKSDLRKFGAEPVREFARSSTANEDKLPLRLADFARDHRINETSNMARLRARGRAAVGVFLGFTALGAAWAILRFV
jgi:hypothetical protein